jgi:hypothetical protein
MAIRINGTIVVDDSRNLVNVNSAVFTGNTGISIPKGTTAQRAVSPVLGTLRYNTESDRLEVYKTAGWGSVGTPESVRLFASGIASGGDNF